MLIKKSYLDGKKIQNNYIFKFNNNIKKLCFFSHLKRKFSI